MKKGLIHKDNLALAGDGTPVATSHRERKNAYANVRKMASLTVTVTVTFLSLTVTSAGIPLATASIMDMIYICWSIHRVISRYFPIIPVLQHMIRMDSFRPFFE